MDNKILKAKETKWNREHQTMKTLEQIHKILKDNNNEFGVYDTKTIDRELMSYTILSTQKGLDDIAKLFASYRERLLNY